MSLTPGTKLGPHEILALSSGREVYVAEDTNLSRKMALKVVPPEMT